MGLNLGSIHRIAFTIDFWTIQFAKWSGIWNASKNCVFNKNTIHTAIKTRKSVENVKIYVIFPKLNLFTVLLEQNSCNERTSFLWKECRPLLFQLIIASFQNIKYLNLYLFEIRQNNKDYRGWCFWCLVGLCCLNK